MDETRFEVVDTNGMIRLLVKIAPVDPILVRNCELKASVDGV